MQRALSEPLVAPDLMGDEADAPWARRAASSVDAQLLWLRADLEASLLRLDAARASLREARAAGRLDPNLRELIEAEESRIDVLSGDPTAALARLRPRLRGANRLATALGWSVAAIAAKAAGDDDAAKRARAECKERKVDVAELDKP